MWIASLNEQPFAYIQDYTLQNWAMHHFASLPSGSRGIDQFIGEPAMFGRGHGSAFIRAHSHDAAKALPARLGFAGKPGAFRRQCRTCGAERRGPKEKAPCGA
jgi:hypothetical protein